MALFVIFLLFPLSTYNYTTALGDAAEYLNNPLRVINGELPYRDFWLLFPPGEVFVPAFIYKAFGLNINIVLISSVVIRALVGTFSFLLGKSFLRDDFFAAMAAMLVFFNGLNDMNDMYFLLLLISALFLMRYLKNNSARELFLSGVFVGLAFLFRFYEVGAASLACLVTIFVYSGLDKKKLLRHTALFCGGVLLVVGLASPALINFWQPMIKQIVIENVNVPTSQYGGSMDLPYLIYYKPYFEQVLAGIKGITVNANVFYIMNSFYHLCYLIIIILSHLLPFLLAGMAIWYLAGKKLKRFDKAVILFFLLWGMFTFPKALGRSDMGHLAQSITPLFFLLVFLLQKSIEVFNQNKTYLNKLTSFGLIVVITLLLLSVPSSITMKAYALAIPSPNFEVSTQFGTLLLKDESEAYVINAVIAFINQNTKEGDYIFVTPAFAPPFYALTNRKNPTYYDSLIDLVARPSEEKQMRVCNNLTKTKLIVHHAYWALDNKEELKFLKTCPILQGCIEDNFKLVIRYGHYWIYVPKAPNA